MRKWTGRLIAFGMILCLLALTGLAAAEGLHNEVPNDTLEIEAEPGYDGRITYGKVIPVRVTVRNNGADLEGTVAVNTYASTLKYDRYEAEIFVPAGGERTVVLPVKIGVRQEILTVEVLQDGEVICAVNTTPEGIINPSAMMIGVLSTRPQNLSCLDISQEDDTLQRYEFWKTVELTPETLPDDGQLLDAFGMIVLDDVDPAQLTDKQQKALKAWVESGHVLISGGGTNAPQNLAFLGEWTELRTEDFAVSDRVHDGLEGFIGRKATGKHPEITLAKITGADPMVSDARGNGLTWRISAGEGCVYQLAWEAGDPALNSESLMHVFFQQMLIDNDATLYYNILYPTSMESAQVSPDSQQPLDIGSVMPAAAVIIAGAALIGGVLWIVLKKKDASKWMWVGIPALALIAAIAVTLLAGGSPMGKPAAATCVNLVQNLEGTVTRYTGMTAAAPRPGLHSWSMDGEKLAVQLVDEYYYWMDENEDEAPKEPVKLRSIVRTGEQESTAVNAESPWETFTMFTTRTADTAGLVEAEIWMEADGLHGTIVNGTQYTLKEGAVVCLYGFAKIPALKPGESADFAMIAADAADPSSPKFTDGVMIRNTSTSFYDVVNQMYYGDQPEQYDPVRSTLEGLTTSAASQLQSERNRKNGTGSSDTGVIFVYSAQPEGYEAPDIYADGEKIESTSTTVMLTAEMKYLTVGKTGVVFRAAGMDQAVRCSVNEAGMPEGDMLLDNVSGKYQYYYFPLSEKPTFRFTPEGLTEMEISRLVIGMEEWYLNELKAYVLNVKAKEWVEFTPNQPLKNPDKYIDADGNIYVQFRPVSGDSYSDIPAPSIMLEGRVLNAEP